jgi:hypothetical protein
LELDVTEEFAIYLNYVRKLGFTETPDYNFLRDLFTKALRATGENEDGVYDWMLLNGGKGWQVTSVSTKTSTRSPPAFYLSLPLTLPPLPYPSSLPFDLRSPFRLRFSLMARFHLYGWM